MLTWLFSSYAGGGYPSSLPLTPMPEKDPYLEQRLHSLEAACSGLWELLKVKNGYTDQDLIDVIKAMEANKQVAASNPASAENVCPKCGHKMLTRNHTRCLWCGADVPANPF